MRVMASLAGSLMMGGMILSGCASGSPAATVTATSAPTVVRFDPATSGKMLAARLDARAKPKTPGEKLTGMECKNFPNTKVGTHTDCQVGVNGVKKGFLVTFTQRDGHYQVASQKLTW